jgi:mannose-1-phosphate guanylyltransferase
MRAMILAAGLGTRLRPLTMVRPKVLTPITGTCVLDFWIRRLHRAGFEAIVINAYHLSELLVAAVRNIRWPVPVHVRLEPVLLGTGGGIRNVLDFFEEEPFVVINGDIICDVPIPELQRQYVKSGSSVGLLMQDCPEFNNVAVDSHGCILGFGQEAVRLVNESRHRQCLAFTGIHIIHPGIFDGFSAGQPGDILTIYRKMIDAGYPPLALRIPSVFWREVGSIDRYRRLHEELGNLKENLVPPLQTGKKFWIDPEADVSPNAHLRGYVSVGRGSRVAEGGELENSILWDGVEVLPGSRLRNCIVADGVVVTGRHENEILTGSIK